MKELVLKNQKNLQYLFILSIFKGNYYLIFLIIIIKYFKVMSRVNFQNPKKNLIFYLKEILLIFLFQFIKLII